MRVVPKLLAQWRRDANNLELLNDMLAHADFYDFELDASMFVLSTSARPWQEWLHYAPAIDEQGRSRDIFIEMWMPVDKEVDKATPVAVSVTRGKLMIHVENDSRIETYPLSAQLETDEQSKAIDELYNNPPENLREPLDRILGLCQGIGFGLKKYGTPSPDMEPDDIPYRALPVSADAFDLLVDGDVIRRGTLPLCWLRFGLAAISLLCADREVVHVQAERLAARTTMKGTRGTQRLRLPERYTVPFSLLKKIVVEHVDTGRVTAERERIRKRQHEVRGHERRLRSGRVVQVRAHKRGDPLLGVVHAPLHRVTAPPKL